VQSTKNVPSPHRRGIRILSPEKKTFNRLKKNPIFLSEFGPKNVSSKEMNVK
jgi:hypothetical protein